MGFLVNLDSSFTFIFATRIIRFQRNHSALLLRLQWRILNDQIALLGFIILLGSLCNHFADVFVLYRLLLVFELLFSATLHIRMSVGLQIVRSCVALRLIVATV